MLLKKFVFTCTVLSMVAALNVTSFAAEQIDNQSVIVSTQPTKNNTTLDLSNYEVGQTFYVDGVKGRIDEIQVIDNAKADYKEVKHTVTYEHVYNDYDPPGYIFYSKKYLLSTYSGTISYVGNEWKSYQDGTGQGVMKAKYEGKIYKE